VPGGALNQLKRQAERWRRETERLGEWSWESGQQQTGVVAAVSRSSANRRNILSTSELAVKLAKELTKKLLRSLPLALSAAGIVWPLWELINENASGPTRP
jgi:hypothetical protein